MKRIEVRVWIDRPAEEVYAYVVDLDRWPEWRSDVVGGELLTEGPVRVGTRARGFGKILGRPFTIDVERDLQGAHARDANARPVGVPQEPRRLEGRPRGSALATA